MLVSGDVGIGKPDAGIFRLALEKLGVQPERTLHIGDSLVNDVGGGNSVGIRTVWLNRHGEPRCDDDPVPDYEIRDLKELVGLLDQVSPTGSTPA